MTYLTWGSIQEIDELLDLLTSSYLKELSLSTPIEPH